MPQRWVMKYGLQELTENSGSFVRNAHECLDKPLPRNANLYNTSSWRGGRTSWRLPERDQGIIWFVVFCCTFSSGLFSFAKKWLRASARCTTSRCSAGMPSLWRLSRTRMEKSCRRESLSMVDLGNTSPFWIWWDTAVYILQMYSSHPECKIIHNWMLSVRNVSVAVSVAPDDLFRLSRHKRPAIWRKVGQHSGQM